MSHCNEMICQHVTLLGYAEQPKVADAVIEADDSAPYLLSAGDCGTPVALRHAALRLAKPRCGVTADTSSTSPPSVEAQAVQ